MSTAGGGTVYGRSDTATPVSFAATVTSAVVVAANPARKGLILTNTSPGIAYIHYGATAVVLTAFTARVAAGAEWVMPGAYTGPVHGIFVSGTTTGGLVGTELT